MNAEDHFWQSPGMYIGVKSVTRLQCFFTGVKVSRGDMFAIDVADFEEWVVCKTGKNLNGKSWMVALVMADNDEEKAFDLWAEWYHEFKRLGKP